MGTLSGHSTFRDCFPLPAPTLLFSGVASGDQDRRQSPKSRVQSPKSRQRNRGAGDRGPESGDREQGADPHPDPLPVGKGDRLPAGRPMCTIVANELQPSLRRPGSLPFRPLVAARWLIFHIPVVFGFSAAAVDFRPVAKNVLFGRKFGLFVAGSKIVNRCRPGTCQSCPREERAEFPDIRDGHPPGVSHRLAPPPPNGALYSDKASEVTYSRGLPGSRAAKRMYTIVYYTAPARMFALSARLLVRWRRYKGEGARSQGARDAAGGQGCSRLSPPIWQSLCDDPPDSCRRELGRSHLAS